MSKFHISEYQWNTIYRFLLQIPGLRVFDKEHTRIFIEAVYYLTRTGCQWRMLPSEYGKWKTIFSRFNDWSKKGIWKQLHQHLTKNEPKNNIMIDGTINRAHACAAGYEKGGSERQGLGKSKGGHTTKISAITNENGTLLDFKIVPGNEHDIVSSYNLVKNQAAKIVIADKAYDCDELIKAIEINGGKAVIPPKSNRIEQREYDETKYKARCIIEIFFWCSKIF